MTVYTSPITGDLAEFFAAYTHYEVMGETITSLEATLQNSFGPNQGESIVALEQVWAEIEIELGQVRVVSEDIASILTSHHSMLSQKIDEAEGAVTSATQRWDELQEATAIEDRCRSVVNDLVDQLNVAIDEVERARIQDELDWARAELGHAVEESNQARQAVAQAENRLDQLRDEEEQMNEQTATQLRSVKLGDLQDPGRLERWVRTAGRIYVELQFGELLDIAKGIDALIDGRYADMALHFKDALDGVLLKAAIVVLVVSWVVPPAGIVVTGLVVGGLASAAIGGAAWQQGWTHPETGETTSAWDAGFDLVMAVAPLRPLRAANAGVKAGGGRSVRAATGAVRDAVVNPGLRQSATRLRTMKNAAGHVDDHIRWAQASNLSASGRKAVVDSATDLRRDIQGYIHEAQATHIAETAKGAEETAVGVVGSEVDDAVKWVAEKAGASQ